MRFPSVQLLSWGSRVRVLLAQLRTPLAPGAPEIPGEAVEVWQPPGLRARPVVRQSTEALEIEAPNGERVALVVDKGRDEGAVEPEDGGAALVGVSPASAATTIYLRADGTIEVTAAAGKKVVVQGGVQPFVRGTAFADALDGFLDGLDTFADAIAHALPGPGGALTVASVLAAQEALAPSIAALKEARAQYLSTKIAGD